MLDFMIKNVNIVNEDEAFWGNVAVKDGKVAAVTAGELDMDAAHIVDGQGLFLLPGGVDAHVHIRYPGSAHRENFITGTQAAAAGGTTTIIEHPISTPPQYSPEILAVREKAYREQGIVDAAFLGAAGGDHLEEIGRIAEKGIVGFKTFLHEPPEGREEEFAGLCCSNNLQLYEALSRIAQTGLLAAAHTEDNDLVSGNIQKLRAAGKTYPRAHSMSRPPLAEVMAVQRLLTLAKEAGARTYLVHISAPQSVELALAARRDGQEVYIETCPQYLYMDETWLDRYGAYVKCNPALRSRELSEAMWKYVEDGTVDVISSDHAPYTVEEKEKSPEDIFAAPSGFPGLETRLPFMMKAVKDGKLSLKRTVGLLCSNPARIFGLEGKGRIAVGYDADFVLLNPYETYTLDSGRMFTKAKDICRFLDGTVVSGKPKMVILRGKIVFKDGVILAEPGLGRVLHKKGV